MLPITIEDLVAILRSKWLFVRPAADRALIGLQRTDIKSDESTDVERCGRMVQIRRWEFDGNIVFLEDESYVESIRESWSFRNTLHPFFGEPNLDCIQITLESLNSLLPVILNYYFGLVVSIGEWQIPIHQHPQWSYVKVERAIGRAQYMTCSEFEKIRLGSYALQSERPALVEGNEIHSTMDDLLYYRVVGEDTILFLRMDCERAVICPKATDEEKKELVEMYLKDLRTNN